MPIRSPFGMDRAWLGRRCLQPLNSVAAPAFAEKLVLAAIATRRSFSANLLSGTNQFFDLSRDDRNCLKSLLILRLISSKTAGSFSLNSSIARFVSAM